MPPATLMDQRSTCHFDELTTVVQAAEMIGGGGMAAAPVCILQAPDQLLVDVLGLLQRREGVLTLAQQAQGPSQAGQDHQRHAKGQPELPGIGRVDGPGDLVLALADDEGKAMLGPAPEDALVSVTLQILGQRARRGAIDWQWRL